MTYHPVLSSQDRDPFDQLMRDLILERYGKPVKQAEYGSDTFSVSLAMGQAQAMTELLAEFDHVTAAAVLRVACKPPSK